MTQALQATLDAAWEDRANFSPKSAPPEIVAAVEPVIADLNGGRLRVATRDGVGQWTTHQWIKKAVLLSFRLKDNAIMRAGDLGFFDKVPTKFSHLDEAAMRASGVRVVPPAVARRGSYLAKGVILMPSYVNIGAYVDEGTMVDTWATVGSCAQIGKNVHLSGGVGIGGVLEPMQAGPTIIEDNCFIGARSEVVEGVIVEENSVISMGVYIGQSTPIYDRATGVRVVPPAVARRGSFIAKGAILMPSYVNIGAWVGEGTMVDTWATVGSCAQVGNNVHLSGGVGLGGVLEPLQANPTIIEDNCFIGARSEVVEGVIVEENSVISMGVYIGQSTPIYDREADTVTYGRIPAGSVVVSGNLPKAGGKYSMYCAVIVKRVDAKTRSTTSLNDLLRD